MAQSSFLKIAGAFLAGLVLALASALLYMRVQHREVTVARVEQAPPPAHVEDAPAADADGAAAPDPLPPPSVASAPLGSARRKAEMPSIEPPAAAHVRKSPVSAYRPVRRSVPNAPVQVVQNTLPPADQGQPATYPVLNQDPSPAQPVSEPPAAAPQPPPPSPAVPAPQQVTLEAGTSLVIRLGETLSTEHNYTGDTFRGTLDQPIIRNGFIIAEKGSKVLGRIGDATAAGRVRGAANLNVTLTEINTTDGQRIRVDTNSVEKRGTASTGSDAAKIAGGAALGAIIGALGGGGKGAAIGAGAGGAAGTGVVLGTRGKPAVLPNESLLTFQLAAPVTITEKLDH